jgi:hypothetical protein
LYAKRDTKKEVICEEKKSTNTDFDASLNNPDRGDS